VLPFLNVKPKILIVCEGKNTEPSYFNQFQLSSAHVKAFGRGFNTVSLVKQTYKEQLNNEYDQIWCVFDKDDFSDGSFNNAILLANQYGFGVGYSNQSFEYWILLHFEDHQGGGMDRKEYGDKINQYLSKWKVTYDGTGDKKISEEIFNLLELKDDKTGLVRRDLAIARAERNYNLLDHTNPAKEESSTTVFSLVKELLKYL
jgi:hypothetical protein